MGDSQFKYKSIALKILKATPNIFGKKLNSFAPKALLEQIRNISTLISKTNIAHNISKTINSKITNLKRMYHKYYHMS